MVSHETRTETQLPKLLQPIIEPTWTHVDFRNLAKSGIYLLRDFNTLTDSIMLPSKKKSILSNMARKVEYSSNNDSSSIFAKVLTESLLGSLSDSI